MTTHHDAAANPAAGPTTTSAGSTAPDAVNEVRLVGRVSGDPERREMPSGDQLWTLRLVVARPPADPPPRVRVDTLDLACWSARVRRSVSRWRDGDVVAVDGSLRRRFYRTPAGSASRVEVEVTRARLIRRATT